MGYAFQMVRSLLIVVFLCGSIFGGQRAHPRLQVDEALLTEIRTLRDANNPLWMRVQKFNGSGREKAQAHSVVLSNMLGYLVTRDSAAFDHAWQFVRGKIYRNKTDASGGFMPILELFKDQHQAAFIGGDFMGVIAHFYDWGYDRLSEEQRKDVAKWLVDAATYTYVENRSSHAFLRNDGASVAFGLAATAYALRGDTPEAEKVMSFFRDSWSEIVKGLDIMGQGGAAGEGNAYGSAPTALRSRASGSRNGIRLAIRIQATRTTERHTPA